MAEIVSILIPVGLALIMAVVGLALTPRDFLRVARVPRAVLAGLAAQLILLPTLALVLVWLWPLPPALALGVIILSACPGGITSNLLTHLAYGDTALSITLTAISSVCGLITVPLIVGLGLELFGTPGEAPIGVGGITLGVFVITGIPLALGMLARARWPAWALRVEPTARRIAGGLFALIVIAAFANSWSAMMANLAVVGAVIAALNVATMASGYGLAATLALPRPQRIAITLECGLQNAAIGLFVAGTLLGSPEMMIPILIYAVVMNITALAVLGSSWVARAEAGSQRT